MVVAIVGAFAAVVGRPKWINLVSHCWLLFTCGFRCDTTPDEPSGRYIYFLFLSNTLSIVIQSNRNGYQFENVQIVRTNLPKICIPIGRLMQIWFVGEVFGTQLGSSFIHFHDLPGLGQVRAMNLLELMCSKMTPEAYRFERDILCPHWPWIWRSSSYRSSITKWMIQIEFEFWQISFDSICIISLERNVLWNAMRG